MKLIFINNKNEIFSIPFDILDVDDIIFGTSKVKEISFINFIEKKEDEKLNSLYQQIIQIDYSNVVETIVEFTENNRFSYYWPIKTIHYRDAVYMQAGVYRIQENLSIRFQLDNEIIRDEEELLLKCSPNCVYFKNNFCKKYKEKINNGIIGKLCLLDSHEELIRKETLKIFENTYKEHGMNSSREVF